MITSEHHLNLFGSPFLLKNGCGINLFRLTKALEGYRVHEPSNAAVLNETGGGGAVLGIWDNIGLRISKAHCHLQRLQALDSNKFDGVLSGHQRFCSSGPVISEGSFQPLQISI